MEIHRPNRFLTRLSQCVVVFDGAMGSYLQQTYPDAIAQLPCLEMLNLERPDIVKAVHTAYLEAGAEVIETNTFQANRLKLAELGLKNKAADICREGASIATAAAKEATSSQNPRFVAGSIGPAGYLLALSEGDPTAALRELEAVFYDQACGLIQGGVDLLLLETFQDLIELKQAIWAVNRACTDLQIRLPILAQITLNANQKMLLGADISGALASIAPLEIEGFGLNCSTGPNEMENALQYLQEYSPKWISCIPNAGLPEVIDGHLHYPLAPAEFSDILLDLTRRFGIHMVGGCCGTTPQHIHELAVKVKSLQNKKPAGPILNYIASQTTAVSLKQEPRPLIIGERINSQGSQKIKALLLQGDFDGIQAIARDQVNSGAHLLDISVALTESSEEKLNMGRLVNLLNATIDIPIMVDSTEPEVIETALASFPGRAIINSLHLEKRAEDLLRIFELSRKFGAPIVVLAIDTDGMALTREKKLQVFQKVYQLATQNHQIPPESLIFDPLTFTLATGEEAYRETAKETLETLKAVKKAFPQSYTLLGVSNISHGLKLKFRQVLNSVFLNQAVQAGLDMAIINPANFIPFHQLSTEEIALAEALIFNHSQDALTQFIQYFDKKPTRQAAKITTGKEVALEDQIIQAILDREGSVIEDLVRQALLQHSPHYVVNDILLAGMKAVGQEFARGELILPFVLQSAIVLKKGLDQIAALQATDATKRGKILLATVFGDIHDIGKNLVGAIIQNNGYEVLDLGKNVPNETIVEKALEHQVDAIGLSALLVTTAQQISHCIDKLKKLNLAIPVLIGGAAINEQFAARLSEVKAYPAGIYYAKDAFAGLTLFEKILQHQPDQPIPRTADPVLEEVTVAAISPKAAPPLLKPPLLKPLLLKPLLLKPPFIGTQVLPDIPPDQVLRHINKKWIFQVGWKIQLKDPRQKEQLLEREFEPIYQKLLSLLLDGNHLRLDAILGYFRCYAEEDTLHILHEARPQSMPFPPYFNHKSQSLAAYFAKALDGPDLIPIFICSARLSGDLSKTIDPADVLMKLYLHGFMSGLAEATADYIEQIIRTDLKLDENSGRRFSPGYPSCPDLSLQKKLFSLLEPDRIGVKLTDGFQMIPETSISALFVPRYHQ